MQNRRDEDLLKQQVLDIMEEEQQDKGSAPKKSKKKKRRALKVVGLFMVFLLITAAFLVGTAPGRRLIYKAASSFVFNNVQQGDESGEEIPVDREPASYARKEKDITNYLIFGIEKIKGARNTDSMMIATINTKDKTVKLTSLLRDSYVEIPGYKKNKLNSAYSKGGTNLLIETIEMNYKIHLDGYMSVDFDSFENIVDLLGGVTIELGKEEAKYLNETNYISNKEYRNVKPGVNKLNGNQALGYSRVRKVKTLGGASSDYGRVVRQQRVLSAIFDSYKSTSLLKLLPITKECLGYVTTNLSQKQIENAMAAVIENKITTLETTRIPVDGAFDAPKKYEGIGYPIILDWDVNRVELYKFIFGESESEAKARLAEYNATH